MWILVEMYGCGVWCLDFEVMYLENCVKGVLLRGSVYQVLHVLCEVCTRE